MEDFWTWLRHNWMKAAGVVSPFIATLPLKFLWNYVAPLLEIPPDFNAVVPYALNAIAILVALIFLIDPPEGDSDNPKSSAALKEFYKWWRILWLAFFVAYLVMGAMYLPVQNPCKPNTIIGFQASLKGCAAAPAGPAGAWYLARAFVDAASLAVFACVFMCYFSLAQYRGPERNIGGAVAAVFVVIFLPELWIVYKGYSATATDNWRFFALAFYVWPLIFGLIGSLSLTVLVGRLESRVISPPLIVILLLYLYAAMQLVVNALDGASAHPHLQEEAQRLIERVLLRIIIVAVFLKALLFLFGHWLLHSGVLLYYMDWMDKADDVQNGIDMERDAFVRRIQNRL